MEDAPTDSSELLTIESKQTAPPLVNKHHQNEGTLTEQKPTLKCCQTADIFGL